MEFDRFDIVEAHYWHAVDYHGGQWSDLYAGNKEMSVIAEHWDLIIAAIMILTIGWLLYFSPWKNIGV